MILRVILLKRIAQLNAGCFEEVVSPSMPKDIQGPWIVLGHFDAMYTWLPDTSGGFFNAIHSISEQVAALNSGSAYFHPLYLIDEKSESRKEERNFWGSQDWFISVERIHFAQTIYDRSLVEQFSQELEEQAKIEGCQIRIYRAMELSDMVVVIRSNRMDHLLNFALSLQGAACVGKVYTYLGMCYQHLRMKAKTETGDQIPMLSMRFSVSHFDQAMALLEKTLNFVMGESQQFPIYSVTGVDDIAVNLPCLPTWKLVALYRYWFLPSSASLEASGPPLGDAFGEITSRVGIPTSVVSPCKPETCQATSTDPHDALIDACTILTEQLHQQLEGRPATRGTYWYQPLAELTKSLVRICQTPVLDEFVFLLFPGARSLIENLSVCADRSLSDQETEKCNIFVEKWSHLMEHVMRIEGQLTHHPDMRPILYNIPVVMLEYMMAVLNQVARILQSGHSPGHSFLLVPQLSQQVEAVEIFIAQGNRPGLVLVTLPLRALYDPVTVQMALCHEACHFVGETYRKRKERIPCFAQATAVLMAKILFASYDESLIDVITEKICHTIRQMDGQPVIRNMYDTVTRWIDRLFIASSKEYANLLFCVLDTIRKKNRPHFRLNLAINDAGITSFSKVLYDLSTLFREIYADICMMFLLEASPCTYLKSIAEELDGDNRSILTGVMSNEPETLHYWKNKSNSEDDCAGYAESLAIRIYVTLIVLGEDNLPDCSCPNPSNGYVRLLEEVQKLHEELKGNQEPKSRVIPLGSIDALIEYSKLCYQGLLDGLSSNPELAVLRKQFNKTSPPSFDYSSILEAIQSDRKKMVDELKRLVGI